MKANSKAELATKVIEENLSITANRTLAKILFNKYPMQFKDVEAARVVIRDVQNKLGKTNIRPSTTAFTERLARLRAEHQIDFREQEDKTPYTFSDKINKALVLGDFHIPYTDPKALDLALEYGFNKNVDCIIINGDFLDFSTISRFSHKPNEMGVREQLENGIEMLKYLQGALGVKVVYHYGNHDVRCELYMIRQAPELYYNNKLEKLLNLEALGVDHVDDYRFMKFGNLNIAHGHHIVKGIFAPVNAARGVFTKTNTSTMINHVHRTSEHIESDMNGKIIGCYSNGALTTVKPTYNPQVSKHNQGFSVVEKDPANGDFIVDSKKIINYKIR
jgi:predicted phosphodiesterase